MRVVRLLSSLLLLSALAGCRASAPEPAWKIAEGIEASALSRAQALALRLNITIVPMGEPFGKPEPFVLNGQAYRAEAIDAARAGPALERICDELERYPLRVIARTGLRRVLLVSRLHCGDTRLVSFVLSSGIIILDIDRRGDQVSRAVHHELFHLLDRQSLPHDPQDDAEWTVLNAPTAVYTDALGLQTDRQWQRVDPNVRRGFVSSYARFAVMEDKAELYEWMVYRPSLLDARQEQDEVLRAKRRLLIGRLARTIDPTFADAFWQAARDAEARRVPR